MHPVDAFLLFISVVLIPLGLIGAWMTHRQRLADDSAEAEERGRQTPAE
ncbi:MAG: hypothetical protein NW203_13580 [Hyphomonadaceae bacterium]|nr:hypothetical protein [Hyphomonadaceae bacterium]